MKNKRKQWMMVFCFILPSIFSRLYGSSSDQDPFEHDSFESFKIHLEEIKIKASTHSLDSGEKEKLARKALQLIFGHLQYQRLLSDYKSSNALGRVYLKYWIPRLPPETVLNADEICRLLLPILNPPGYFNDEITQIGLIVGVFCLAMVIEIVSQILQESNLAY